MKRNLILTFSVLSICLGVSFVYADIDLSKLQSIPNVVLLDDGVIGGGTLNETNIKQAKQQGIKTIIDIRSPEEGTGEERVLVQENGMNYFNVPVKPYTLRKAQADVLSHVLSNPENKPVILHGNSGNRVGALWGLYSKHYRGMSTEEAFKEAVAKGLRSDDLKDVVLKLLKQ